MMQKAPPPVVRILVLGAQDVGKSAVTVRFLTQRFIGEYSSQKDLLYCSQTQVTGSPVDVEILDTTRDQTDSIPSEKLDWTSAFVIVYSISSKSSFLVAADCLRHLLTRSQPILLLANKKDLEHAREVSTEEGRSLAKELGNVAFAEVSAAEGHAEVAEAFRTIIVDACAAVTKCTNVSSSPTNTTSRRKISVVSVSKIISAMFGRGGAIVADHHNQKKRPSLSL
ncbi:ras-related and estrogen-regulated growth inhibitor-like protein isoform X1 [Stegodyphus dumicola]|uniref:ras-related and estrogen-regulated growth inhibitor-like protein isoform X1 n=1 Tax=Stegodyphus dumicola TaxID=202533 RepID=UPI0015A86808|nr:ras-related and estrogen-regulated growth inhibitor-like protein isoform X1 [Stegodyphus dumicola]